MRWVGSPDGNVGYFCIPEFINRQRTNLLDHQDPIHILKCANDRYNALASAITTFSSSCSYVTDTCRNASIDGNNWWAYTGCYKNVLQGFKIQPNTFNTNKTVLPIPDWQKLEQCRREETIVEIQGACKQVGIYCREQGYTEQGVAIDNYCRNLLLRGYSISPLTGKPLPAVNPDVLERCRLDNPLAGICSTPCERIDIRCRQAGIYGYADGLLWPYCHLPLLQGNTRKQHPTTSSECYSNSRLQKH